MSKLMHLDSKCEILIMFISGLTDIQEFIGQYMYKIGRFRMQRFYKMVETSKNDFQMELSHFKWQHACWKNAEKQQQK